jgi:DNA gyrase inhibitor GyrI/uncharacterized glyoxalase superfamily protein PhnB
MPHLTVRDVNIAVQWYEQVFGMCCRLRIPENEPVHAELVWQDMVIMLAKAGEIGMPQAPVNSGVASPVGLYLYCEDVDAMHERAVKAGARIQMQLQDMFWGDRMFTLIDLEGHVWSFATKVGEFDPTKMPSPQQIEQGQTPPPREHQSMTVRTMPDLRVFYARKIGPYSPAELGPFFKLFIKRVLQHNLFTPYCMVIGICQDDPRDTDDKDCRYDAGITVNADLPCPEGLHEQILPGGDYAVVLHKGPYDKLAETWQWIGEVAFPSIGRECRDQPPFECYLNSPEDVFPDELLTEIWIPLY